MKVFVTGCEPFNYHPKDKKTGVRNDNVLVNALNICIIGKNIKTRGYFTDVLYVDDTNQKPLYDFIFAEFGASADALCNWAIEIEYNSSGFIEMITKIKKYDSMWNLPEFLGVPPQTQK